MSCCEAHYPSQSDDVKYKIREAFYRNGTCKTSSQQIDIYQTLKANGYNVELNYPVSKCSLDIALFIDNLKIDIEYDGAFWHNSKYDIRRDKFIQNDGWKVIRIKSRRLVPTINQLIESINKVIEEDMRFVEIILQDWEQAI